MKYGIVLNVNDEEIQVKPVVANLSESEIITLSATTLQCNELEEILSSEENPDEPIMVMYDENENVLIEE